MRDRARTVVVGAGIVGASAAYHLSELGDADVLVLDQGPLFETGGSSSHAPGLAFQTNGSRMMCRIAQDSVALYATLESDGGPCWYGVGGIEVATTVARMQELKRRLGFARSYGLEGAELLTPAEAAEKVPLLDTSAILGAYHVPSDGIAMGVGIATALGRKAAERGVELEGEVTVTGFDVREGRVHGVRTDRGDVGCERVLICAGIWGPSVGALADVSVPLVAVQHQLVWTDPVPELEGETREVGHPILRHQDMAMYFRHRGDHYAVGNYHHEPIATPQRALRRPGDEPTMPSLMPFTPSDFEAAEAEAARLLPALRGRMRPDDPERSINGMFSFTPDAGSIVGESARVRGVWLCEAVWVTHAGGFGRMVAEWMEQGEPSFDLAEADANRFYPYMTTPPFVLERGKQQYREVYDIIHPRQQMARPRKLRLSPFYSRQVELGAEFVVGAGWERPEWYEANAPLVPEAAPWLERDPWAARFWSPIEGAEHLATR
ncbi:MAG TPA: FAD-dependent oxidoreductase, partial [Actinomycetota bacterium]|nr:FAD-dependent oxidoreductase [Actinomycetota bacterium]